MHFTKMHGLGNDFVVVDNREGRLQMNAALVKSIADRREGVGCDQLLLIESGEGTDADLLFRIFNADGSEVEHCGNGARCVAAFAQSRGLSNQNPLRMQLPTRIISARVMAGGEVSVDMGSPAFAPWELPFAAPTMALVYTLQTEAGTIEVGAVSMGNPHAVTRVENVATLDLAAMAIPVQLHPWFPQGVNVGAMQIVNRNYMKLRVYERGVGETQACGTGACAAVAVARKWDLVDPHVHVDLPGGRLSIDWEGPGQSLWMQGPISFVFDGEMTL